MKLFAGCREHIKAVSFFCLIFFLFNVLLSTEINFDMLAKKREWSQCCILQIYSFYS